MRKTKTTVKFQVTLVLPVGVTTNEAQQYIAAAIKDYGKDGSLHLMAALDSDTVKVSLLKKEVDYG